MRALIQLRDLSQFQKLLALLAGRVGQVVNLASLTNEMGVSATTIRNRLSVLKASYVVFELPPFFENVRKRVIRSPKIFFTDVGLAAFRMGIRTEEQAARDPLRGNLYENLIVADIVKGALTPVEIKSAGTFSLDFTRGLERFRASAVARVATAAVLYDGEQQVSVQGVRAFNPLRVKHIWETLTSPPGQKDS
jgi:uncharacterized protein